MKLSLKHSNWKTTSIGMLSILAGTFLLYAGKITWDQFLIFLAIGGLGITAKDGDATGGKRSIK